MAYTITPIAPAGRNKYGAYNSASNLTRRVINVSYGGNSTTQDISNPTEPEPEKPQKSYSCKLSSNSTVINPIEGSGITETILVLSNVNLQPANTFIGQIGDDMFDEQGEPIEQENYSISGVPESGMTITVSGQGTSDASINIAYTSAFTQTEGQLIIPVSVYFNTVPDAPLGDDIYC